jgi:hypothetical protein
VPAKAAAATRAICSRGLELRRSRREESLCLLGVQIAYLG